MKRPIELLFDFLTYLIRLRKHMDRRFYAIEEGMYGMAIQLDNLNAARDRITAAVAANTIAVQALVDAHAAAKDSEPAVQLAIDNVASAMSAAADVLAGDSAKAAAV